MNTQSSEKLGGLTALRIVAALMVFLFHINIHLDFRSHINFIDTTISVGALFMIPFIMASGFGLYCKYADIDLINSPNTLKQFYLKRMIRIFPAYLVFELIMYLFHLSFPKTMVQALVLIPAELFGIQAYFPKLFNYLGNGGTWFVSVIAFMYLLFPFFNKIVEHTKMFHVHIVLLWYALTVYHGVIKAFFGGDFAAFYSNPILRVPEFLIGMMIGAFYLEKKEKLKTKQNSFIPILICLTISAFYIFITNYLFNKEFVNNILFAQNYTFYNYISVPLFGGLIYFLAQIKTVALVKIMDSKIFILLGNLTYAFYLTQTLAIRLVDKWIDQIYFGVQINSSKEVLVVTLVINLIFACFLHFAVEKPINKSFNKYMKGQKIIKTDLGS